MFTYPKQAALGRVIPKTAIYRHASPTRRVQQRFVDQVSRIVWAFKLAPETINLPAHGGVLEIQVFRVALKTDTLDETVLRTIDQTISHPLFYELSYEGRIKMVAAYKRPSEADSSKWVLGDYFATDWLPAETPREPLPLAVNLAGLYERMLRRLMPYPAKDGESLRDHAERLAVVRAKEKERDKLEARLGREKQFNRKVELNGRVRALRKEIEQLTGGADS